MNEFQEYVNQEVSRLKDYSEELLNINMKKHDKITDLLVKEIEKLRLQISELKCIQIKNNIG